MRWLPSCRMGCCAWCSATWNLQRGSSSDDRRLVFPTLTDVAPLAGDALFRVLKDEQRRQLLHDESAQTAVERGDGLIPAVRVRVRTGGQRLPTLQQLADILTSASGLPMWRPPRGAATRQPGVQC